MRINDQSAAIKLAICDDIGERSYDVAEVAAILVQILARLPSVGLFLIIQEYIITYKEATHLCSCGFTCLLYLIFCSL